MKTGPAPEAGYDLFVCISFRHQHKQMRPWFILISICFSQPAPAPACDPTLAVCPGVDCDPPEQAGQILFQSPLDSDYQYLNKPINITFSYSQQTNPAYYWLFTLVFLENSFSFIIEQLVPEIGPNGVEWELGIELYNSHSKMLFLEVMKFSFA